VNFLAHFHQAWPDEGLLVGALEGDYYKGLIGQELPADIAQGVRLHRAIDAYTDSHPQIVAMRAQFPTGLRRYSGILLDLSFDHYLTLHWRQFSDHPLPHFNNQVLGVLEGHTEHLGSATLIMLQRLREYDILNRYHEWQMVIGVAERIGERFSRGNPLLDIGDDVAPLRPHIEQCFLEFYPQLQKFTGDWLSR
jgi:acyl carrier protein phosphodiesterase